LQDESPGCDTSNLSVDRPGNLLAIKGKNKIEKDGKTRDRALELALTKKRESKERKIAIKSTYSNR